MRKKVTANAQKNPRPNIPPNVKKSADKVEKVSLSWAKLISRIYEVNPLLCQCGKEMKIVAFVTHSAEIRRILSGIGWPTEIPEFDPPYGLPERDVCQLLPWTEDGFSQTTTETGPGPPLIESYLDPPHWDDRSDPPFWED
jgi:hypothetical protein